MRVFRGVRSYCGYGSVLRLTVGGKFCVGFWRLGVERRIKRDSVNKDVNGGRNIVRGRIDWKERLGLGIEDTKV